MPRKKKNPVRPYESIQIPKDTILTDMKGTKWRVGESIGSGGFGVIYSVCKVGDECYDYVVKCEPHSNGPLFVEMHFYMRNAKLGDVQLFQKEHGLKSFGMPHMISRGSVDLNNIRHRFLILPRYGNDLKKHFLANGHRFPNATTYRIALQMLDVYEYLHSTGYIHGDLKAANILIGRGEGGGAQTYLLDFGLVSRYKTKNFEPDARIKHNGTIEYTARDSHVGVPTMRADFEILGYNLIEWLGVDLPWVRDKLLSSSAKVQEAKEEFMKNVNVSLLKLFSNGAPTPLVQYMKYVAKMKYNEKPNYAKCRKIFENALKKLKIPTTGDLDFTIKTETNNELTQSKAKNNANDNMRVTRASARAALANSNLQKS